MRFLTTVAVICLSLQAGASNAVKDDGAIRQEISSNAGLTRLAQGTAIRECWKRGGSTCCYNAEGRVVCR